MMLNFNYSIYQLFDIDIKYVKFILLLIAKNILYEKTIQ